MESPDALPDGVPCTQPTVGIVTVVRNAAKDLERTIHSVLRQDYRSVEYIVVDGASSDGTLNVIKSHADRLTHWISEPDRGIYDAMNKGADMASGEWILFMNAGDVFPAANCLSLLREKLAGDADVIVASANKVLVDLLETRVIRVSPGSPADLWRWMPSVHQSILVRRRHQITYRFDTSYQWCADQELLLRMQRDGRQFVSVETVLSEFDCAGGMARDPMIYIRERFRLSRGAVPDRKRLFQFGSEWLHCRIWGTVVKLLKRVIPDHCLLFLRRLRGTSG